ncbi:MAG: hypothetical protein V2J25_05300 [Desulfatiglans sp.]|nr:hypothetical protein [Thermodesulfobacteriota bacterium]MEE4352268.1 hypothetical protein [Desulfatiglans sp.]
MFLRDVGFVIALAGLFLFFGACDSKKEEALKAAREARQKAEKGLEDVKERDKLAQEIIQKKLNAGAKFNSQFEGYATSDEDTLSEEEPGTEDGTLKGFVAVWGSKPGTVGSTEGMTVHLNGEYDSFSENVDSENWFTISVPPGEYTLVINEVGYEYFEKEVTIASGRERLLPPIGLKNE